MTSGTRGFWRPKSGFRRETVLLGGRRTVSGRKSTFRKPKTRSSTETRSFGSLRDGFRRKPGVKGARMTSSGGNAAWRERTQRLPEEILVLGSQKSGGRRKTGILRAVSTGRGAQACPPASSGDLFVARLAGLEGLANPPRGRWRYGRVVGGARSQTKVRSSRRPSDVHQNSQPNHASQFNRALELLNELGEFVNGYFEKVLRFTLADGASSGRAGRVGAAPGRRGMAADRRRLRPG